VYAIAAVLMFSAAAGAPFGSRVSAFAQAQERPQQPSENAGSANQDATFAGTVVQDGQQFDLRDSSGEIFKLDDGARAKPFTGKTVKVTGELNAESKVIHVESIVSAEG
jgi:hypothetical protein